MTNLKNDISEIKEENDKLKEKILHLDLIKNFFFALKEESPEVQFFDFNDYTVDSVIGEDSTSSVKLVIKNDKYAMKELIDSNHKTVQRFLSEGEIMFILHHPCIQNIIAVNYGDVDHPPSLILSLEPGSLDSAIANNKLEDRLKCRITIEIVPGMRYIHHKNYMHRNLKPSNILLSKDNHVRISDFSLAKEEEFDITQSKGIDSSIFMAPELFDDEDESTRYTNKIDVYSFGITLIYIVTGSYPKFSMKNITSGALPSFSGTISDWVRELIVRCLSYEPESRPSFDEIFETLKSNNYDLFDESDGKKLTSKQQNMKEEIEECILKIEAFEFQHKND